MSLRALLADGGRRTLVIAFLLTLPLVSTRIRGADEIEYFSYLRSAVFDHDLEFGNEYQQFYDQDPQGLAGFKATFLDLREPDTQRHINFGPMGSALLWSPFYLLAHLGVLAARAAGATVAADGFSRPYVAAVCWASALYGFLGLLLTHDALRRHAGAPEPAATLAVLAMWLATPAFYYTTVAPAFSHACSLFVVALLLWLWLRARAPGSVAAWAAIGAVGGLAALVREQDLLYLAVPLGGLALDTLRRRTWAGGLARVVACCAAAVVVFVPQLLAYHAINGRYAPSRLVTRKMSWQSPHFVSVLLDPAHGLFVWAPVLFVAFLGLLWLAVRRRDAVAALFTAAFLLQVWINGAVESWTQAGAFGSRRFVSAGVLLAWGLAGILGALAPRLGRAGMAGLAALFVCWNLGLMVQFGLKLMDRQGLEWPRVAVNQVREVPTRVARVAFLLLTDRERLVRETR